MAIVNFLKLNLLAGGADLTTIICIALGVVCVLGAVLIGFKGKSVHKLTKEKKAREQAVAPAVEETVEAPVAEVAPVEAVEEEPAVAPEQEIAEETAEPVAEEVAPAVEEVVAEEIAPATEEPAPTEEVVEQPAPAVEETVEQPVAEVAPVEEKVSYIKSYLAKLSLTRDTSKKGYSRVKNTLLSYAKVKSRISWKEENFRMGRKTVAKLTVKGRTVVLYLAVDPASVDAKYTVADASKQASKASVPCMYKLSGVRRFKYACDLIEKMFADMGVAKVGNENVDYCKHLQTTDMEQLAEIGLVKVSKAKPVNFNKFNK